MVYVSLLLLTHQYSVTVRVLTQFNADIETALYDPRDHYNDLLTLYEDSRTVFHHYRLEFFFPT